MPVSAESLGGDRAPDNGIVRELSLGGGIV